MSNHNPNIFQMIRAQFLIGIVIPLSVGTLTAISISGSFHLPGFLLVMIIGALVHNSPLVTASRIVLWINCRILYPMVLSHISLVWHFRFLLER